MNITNLGDELFVTKRLVSFWLLTFWLHKKHLYQTKTLYLRDEIAIFVWKKC